MKIGSGIYVSRQGSQYENMGWELYQNEPVFQRK